MSIFPLSDKVIPGMSGDNPFGAFSDEMSEMQKNAVVWMETGVVPHLSGMANLSAHPVAAMAAASALGMGVASQMFGMMMGTMSAAVETSTRMANEHAKGTPMHALFPDIFDFDMPDFTEPAEAPKAADIPARDDSASTRGPAVAAAHLTAIAAGAARATPEPEPEPVGEAVQTMMPEDFVKPASESKPEAPDDLKLISGIGPKLEKVLNGLGVWTYRQIAAWTPQEVAWVDDYMQFRGRIERDGWIGQAAGLAKGGK